MITELVIIVLAAVCIVALRVLGKVYKHNRLKLRAQSHGTNSFNEKVNTLIAWRDQIENMPNGYDKMKAKELWLKELDALLASNPLQQPDVLNNIIQFRQFQR